MTMFRQFLVLASLLYLWASMPAYSASIDPNNAAAILESRGLSPQDKRFITAPLFDFSPFSADNNTVVPGFADPLGTGVDPGLRVFSGTVHFMDLLGNFNVAKSDKADDIELPTDALQGINVLDNFLALYLSYNGRAYDTSIMNLRTAEVIERNGLPVTGETSPLTLAGFGSVSDDHKPVTRYWTRCPERAKRERSMTKSLKRQQWPCAVPAACECSVI